jgi:hypothetical protein
MSILDDENILMSGIKENMNNPFYSIREIFIQADKENNCILYPYKNDILKILSTIEIPQYTKWFIDFNVIELVDSSYYGEPGDYYKVFGRINSWDSKTLIFDILPQGFYNENIYKYIRKMLNDYNWIKANRLVYKF